MAKNYAGYKLIKEKIPYEAKGIDNLLVAVKRVLGDAPYPHKLTLAVGSKQIVLQQWIPEAGHTDSLTWHEAVRGTTMVEYSPEENEKTPLQQYWAAIQRVHAEGLDLGRVLIGDKPTFQKWLGVIIPVTKLTVFGVPLEVVPELPKDVFILCGVSETECEPIDLELSVKGVI